MGDTANVYSDARSEYTKQLCSIMVPPYFQFFLGILDKARTEVTKAQESKKLLWQFQTFLNEIPDWNMEKVNTEIGTLQTGCGCDYLEDLLTAVFIAHTKVLTAIRISGKQKKVQITVPKVEHFMFKVLCETSKLLWGSSYLFREDISSIEKQQNYRSVEALLAEGILQAVRAMVPVKNILKDFVSMDEGEEGEDEKALPLATEALPLATEALPTPMPQPATEASEISKEETPLIETSKETSKETPIIEASIETPVEAPVIEELTDLLPSNKSLTDLLPSNNSPSETSLPVTMEGDVPQIRIDTGKGPRVGFTHYDTFFDSENVEGNDIIEENASESESSGIEILEGDAEPLGLSDMDSLDALEGKDEPIGVTDYDVLV